MGKSAQNGCDKICHIEYLPLFACPPLRPSRHANFYVLFLYTRIIYDSNSNYLRYRTEFSYTCRCFLGNTALNEGALTCLPLRTIQHAKYLISNLWCTRICVYPQLAAHSFGHANRHRIGHATGTGLVMQVHRSCKCERSYHHPALVLSSGEPCKLG